MAGVQLNAPVVGMASTPDATGYWLVAERRRGVQLRRRRVFGSAGGQKLSAPVVGMAADHRRQGLLARRVRRRGLHLRRRRVLRVDGRHDLNSPIVGMAAARRHRLLARRLGRRASSPTATPPSTARRARSTSTRPSSAWRRRPAATATGSWPPTAACSPSVTPASRGRRERSTCCPGRRHGRRPLGTRLLAGRRRRRGLHLRRRRLLRARWAASELPNPDHAPSPPRPDGGGYWLLPTTPARRCRRPSNPGASGAAAVPPLQQRLSALGYWVGHAGRHLRRQHRAGGLGAAEGGRASAGRRRRPAT